MTNQTKLWHIIHKFFKHIGVKNIFGIPNDDLHSIKYLDSTEMKFITTRDQRNALFMATGYAQISGELGVCIVGKGPGFTNSLTGILEAKSQGAPLLIIATGTANDQIGMKAFQEVDQMSMVKPIVKWAHRLEEPGRLVWALEKASTLALNGCTGPVYIEIPENIADLSISENKTFQPLRQMQFVPSSQEVKVSLTKLKQAKQPIILVGGGLRHSLSIGKKIEQLAEMMGAAIFSTASGRGVVNENHSYFCGLAGLYTPKLFEELWEKSDVIVTLGSRLEETATFGWIEKNQDVETVQVNVNIDDFNYILNGIKILGHGEQVIEEWMNEIHDKESPLTTGWTNQILKLKSEIMKKKENLLIESSEYNSIKVPEILESIDKVFHNRRVIVQENGLQDIWMYYYPYFVIDEEDLCIVPSEQTSLGFGVAAAMGIKLAKEKETVIAFVGDGAFDICKSELITAVEQQFSIIYIVLHNGGYGWLQSQLEGLTIEKTSVSFTGSIRKHMNETWDHPHIVKMNVTHRSQLTESLKKANKEYKNGKLVILEIDVNLEDIPEEIVNVYGAFPEKSVQD
jgi:acetolactate synthase-1/2/3 large subunit